MCGSIGRTRANARRKRPATGRASRVLDAVASAGVVDVGVGRAVPARSRRSRLRAGRRAEGLALGRADLANARRGRPVKGGGGQGVTVDAALDAPLSADRGLVGHLRIAPQRRGIGGVGPVGARVRGRFGRSVGTGVRGGVGRARGIGSVGSSVSRVGVPPLFGGVGAPVDGQVGDPDDRPAGGDQEADQRQRRADGKSPTPHRSPQMWTPAAPKPSRGAT